MFSCNIHTLTCGMWNLVPWPGIEAGPPVSAGGCLTTGITREVPKSCFDLKHFFASFKILRYLMVIMIAVEETFQFSSVSYEWVKVSQLCPTLSPGHNTGGGRLSLLQGIFPTQGLNPGLLHSRWILYQLNHQGSPLVVIHLTYFITNLEWSLLWLTGIFWMIIGFE